MIRLGELMMILELHRQGVSISAIARRTGRDPKIIRKYIERGIEAPVYGPRMLGRPNKLAPYLEFLRERVTAFPDLTAARLTREIRELGYMGAYTAVKRFLAAIRPENGPKPFEVRFETPPGVHPDRGLQLSHATARRPAARACAHGTVQQPAALAKAARPPASKRKA